MTLYPVEVNLEMILLIALEEQLLRRNLISHWKKNPLIPPVALLSASVRVQSGTASSVEASAATSVQRRKKQKRAPVGYATFAYSI